MSNWNQEGALVIPSLSLSGNSTSFTATAKGNLDDDTVLDIWKNDQNKTLQNTINDITSK